MPANASYNQAIRVDDTRFLCGDTQLQLMSCCTQDRSGILTGGQEFTGILTDNFSGIKTSLIRSAGRFVRNSEREGRGEQTVAFRSHAIAGFAFILAKR